MAQEQASITLSIDDQMSAGLQAIAQQLSSLRNQMRDIGDGPEGKKLPAVIETFTESTKGAAQGMTTLQGVTQGAIREMSAQFTTFAGQSGLGGLARAFKATTETGLALSTAMRGIGGGVSLLVTGGVAATGVTYALGRSIASAYTEAKNLREEMGNISQRSLNDLRRAFGVIGMDAKEADARIESLSRKLLDMSRGSISELSSQLRQFDGGTKFAAELENMAKAGASAEQMLKRFFEIMEKQSDAFKRRFSDMTGISVVELGKLAKALREAKPTFWDAETNKQLESLRQSIKEQTDKITHYWENQWDEAWANVQLQSLPVLTAWLEQINEMGPAIRDTLVKEFNAALDSVTQIASVLKPVIEFFTKRGDPTEPLIDVPRMLEKKKEPAPGAPDTWRIDPYTGERIQKQSHTLDQQTNYLRDIRDILAWLRGQAGGSGSTAPGGFNPDIRTAAFNPGGGIGGSGYSYVAPNESGGGVGSIPGVSGRDGTGTGSGAGSSPMGTLKSMGGGGGFKIGAESLAESGLGAGGGLDRGKFDAMFKGTPMEGQFDTVVSEANKNGIPPDVFAGMIAFETGAGKSAMLRNKNNVAGMFRNGQYQSYSDVGSGIADAARSAGRHWNGRAGGSIDKLGAIWAPPGASNDPNGTNAQWPSGVRGMMGRLGGGSGGRGITLPDVRSAVHGSTAQEGGAVPSGILERAKGIAAAGPGALQRFMADAGYPKSGAWCGQFAASVVKSLGMEPPKGAPVASNWRNFGEAVQGLPQPGDVAIRRGARTGSTGSHVTFVESVDPETGTFRGFGGNQGDRNNPRSSRYGLGRFDFRRAGQDINLAGVGANAKPSAARLDINVNAPKGTRVKTKNDGFEDIRLKQTPMMGSGSAGQDADPWNEE